MRKAFLISAFVLGGGLVLPAATRAASYQVDPEHTSVTFTVRHLLTRVKGRFDRFKGRITFDPAQPEQAKVEGTIDVASINTNVEERDKDLRSARFFDVEKFPKISFVTTKISDISADKKSGKMLGKLTMHGVERPLTLDVSFLGEAKDPWGNVRAAFTATTTINRKDFGLTWNETLETGGVLVGDEITIEIDAEGTVEE
jgi:polyisoprenoid-binding protein YceI